MACVIRAAVLEDAAAIAEVHVAAWRETYRGVMPDAFLLALSVDERRQMWRQALTARAGISGAFVAVDPAGALAGFACCGRQRSPQLPFPGEYWVINILQRWQRRGLGRRLMAAMSERLAADRLLAASLWVVRDNLPARRFYEGLGGRPVLEEPHDHGGFDLVEVAYAWDTLPLVPAPAALTCSGRG